MVFEFCFFITVCTDGGDDFFQLSSFEGYDQCYARCTQHTVTDAYSFCCWVGNAGCYVKVDSATITYDQAEPDQKAATCFLREALQTVHFRPLCIFLLKHFIVSHENAITVT